MNPAIDRATALSRVGGDAELLAEVAQVYLDECDAWLRDLRQAVSESDAPGMHRMAHTIKGAVDVFAASDAHAAAMVLETMGREANWQGVDESVATLEREMTRLRPEVRSLLDT